MRKEYVLFIVAAVVLFTGCVGSPEKKDNNSKVELSGIIRIDGSSTVYPISEAVGEEFLINNPGVRLTVGISGTGGGFKKFCAKEIDINDASRKIKNSEIEICSKNGIEWIELKIAFDGLSVVVSPQNTHVESLTVTELKKIWEPDSTVRTWKDVRSDWPDEEIYLVGPDTDSGTFEYFTETIVGSEKSSRSDYTASADDNVLVQAVAGEKYSLGYFGYAYYFENKEKLKLVAIDDGKGPVLPSEQTISEGSYPVSRPLYMYVNKESLKRAEVRDFLEYYLIEGNELAAQVGYVRMPDSVYEEEIRMLG